MIFKLCAALYLSFSMLVSYSFLSIKTAAILWFITGALQRTFPRQSPAPAPDRALAHSMG
jgi:hypothetical protein